MVLPLPFQSTLYNQTHVGEVCLTGMPMYNLHLLVNTSDCFFIYFNEVNTVAKLNLHKDKPASPGCLPSDCIASSKLSWREYTETGEQKCRSCLQSQEHTCFQFLCLLPSNLSHLFLCSLKHHSVFSWRELHIRWYPGLNLCRCLTSLNVGLLTKQICSVES